MIGPVEFTEYEAIIGASVESVEWDNASLSELVLYLQDGRKVRVIGLWLNDGTAGLLPLKVES